MNVVKNFKVSKNFSLSEFVCKEGKNEVYLDMELVRLLQVLRDMVNAPIEIVSGYRSPSYNKSIGGAENSQHIYGKAADIHVKGYTPEEVIYLAKRIGFNGLGLYDTWAHVDVRDTPAFWDSRVQHKNRKINI